MAKQILITGGLGFIGSHLCQRLLQLGYSVVCIDNLSTGRSENLRPLEGYPAFRFIRWDVTEPFTWEEPLDEIYNLACPASPVHYLLT